MRPRASQISAERESDANAEKDPLAGSAPIQDQLPDISLVPLLRCLLWQCSNRHILIGDPMRALLL